MFQENISLYSRGKKKMQQTYDDLGRPSAQKLLFALRRKGIQVSESEAKDFIARQSTGQIFLVDFRATVRFREAGETTCAGKWT